MATRNSKETVEASMAGLRAGFLYLKEIGKFDIRELTEAEAQRYSFTITNAYCDELDSIDLDKQIPF